MYIKEYIERKYRKRLQKKSINRLEREYRKEVQKESLEKEYKESSQRVYRK